MTDPKDNIKKQLDMRSFATRIWLVLMVIGLSVGIIELVFHISYILMQISIGIVLSSVSVAIFEKRIDRYFQNKRRLQ